VNNYVSGSPRFSRRIASVKENIKHGFGRKRRPADALAKSVGLSLQPAHFQILARREKELNVGRSRLIQILLEIEERDYLLRREVLNRIRRTATPETPKPQIAHANAQISQLESN